jgi:cbb3-type cytochrome oxidase cytochrome c subunit
MEPITLTKPGAVRAEDAGRVHSYLEAAGVKVQGVSISEHFGTVGVAYDGEQTKEQMQSLLDQYTQTESAEERNRREAIEDAVAEVEAIARKPRAARTAAEKIVLGMALGSTEIRKAAGNAGQFIGSNLGR